MIKIKNKKECCGCEACVQACPKHCIDFIPDSQGFMYPRVNESLCVNCGLCNKVCPIINVEDYALPTSTPVLAAYNKDAEQRKTSSSGGIFTLLASDVIGRCGVVFGAAFDKKWNVVHSCAENISQIEPLKRSKYVQSRIGNSYKDVKAFLTNGKHVLFVGTPCQIAGLKRYLRKEYENLITVDVVCHGVPSPMIWQKYLKEKKSEIVSFHQGVREDEVEFTSISFRDKINSWRRYHLSFTYVVRKDGINAIGTDTIGETSSQFVWENDYMLSFLHDYANRPSCFDCKFRNGRCRSDITLADFWGIENLTEDKDLKEDKGISLIMIHSSKGKEMIDRLPCYVKQFAFEGSFRGNPAVFKNWPKPISHGLFFKECRTHSIRYSFEKAHKVQETYEPVLKFKNRVTTKLVKLWQKLV